MAEVDAAARPHAEALGPPPDARLHPALVGVWNAWQHLQHDRPPSMGGVLGIHWTAIDAYARRHRIGERDRSRFDLFHRLLRVLDDEFMEHHRAKGGS